jgi:hypothetical protein
MKSAMVVSIYKKDEVAILETAPVIKRRPLPITETMQRR